MGRATKATKAPSHSDKTAVAKVKEDELFETLTDLPPDPEDPRLTVESAVLAADGKLDVSAYEDLQSNFAGEPSPSTHPYPEKPGVRKGEDVPKGLRVWDDMRAGATGKDGAGWIAIRCKKNEPKKEKWFNIRTCGSWRLAFLLARLQRDLFERGVGVRPRAAAVAAAQEAAQEASGSDGGKENDTAGKPGGDAAPAKTATPQKKRPREPAAKASAQKRARQEKKAEPQPQASKGSALGSDVFAGSQRWQQILAARRAQEDQQQAAAKVEG